MASLELKKFDMKNISFKPNEAKGPVVVLIGRRDTGRLTAVSDLGSIEVLDCGSHVRSHPGNR